MAHPGLHSPTQPAAWYERCGAIGCGNVGLGCLPCIGSICVAAFGFPVDSVCRKVRSIRCSCRSDMGGLSAIAPSLPACWVLWVLRSSWPGQPSLHS